MGFSFGVGVGPLRYSKRLGGKRRRSTHRAGDPLTSISRDVGDFAAMRTAIDGWPREQIKRRHAAGWVGAAFLAVCFLALGLVGVPLALIPLGVTWWGHRQRWARVAARAEREAAAQAGYEQRRAARHMTDADREWLARHDGQAR